MARTLDRTMFEAEVANYAKRMNAAIEDETLLRLSVAEIVDRISLYLQYDEEDSFDPRLVRPVSGVVSASYKKLSAEQNSLDVETSIKSISDNGQSITYGDAAKNYFATVSDGELFGGLAGILRPFRRIRALSE